MVFIDVHCHLDFYKSDKRIFERIERAKKANVGIIINNGVNGNANQKILEMVEKYPEIKAALGFYPVDALKLTEDELDRELRLIRDNLHKIVALGEVGLDLKENPNLKTQKRIFQIFIDMAKQNDKPLIVHSRRAEAETIRLLEENDMKKVIMHCFFGNMNLVKRIIDNGWCFSIPTIIKFSEHFQNLVKIVPISQLFCETDSPYLHPDKKRDNEPANVVEAYNMIAKIKGISLGECEKKIEENYKRLFESNNQ
ncbi:MAG: TatD family hydrolase [Candidatus Pacearchaeota archaeon]|nr:TatD family hydrolase [Candidatus Pacearchaeota archaeon]